jgi:hypothetical protein
MAGTVVDHSTFSGERNRALLLVFRLLDEATIAENLQVNQSPTNRQAPEQKHATKKIEAVILAETGVIRRTHVSLNLGSYQVTSLQPSEKLFLRRVLGRSRLQSCR